MDNALTTAPPAPNPSTPPQSQQPDAQQPSAQISAPTHGQTVAALRQFDAFIGMWKSILKNPDLGKSDLKDAFIESMTKLVGDSIISPSQAVSLLTRIPDKPFDQKKFVEQHYMTDLKARNMVIVHHAAAFAGAPPEPTPNNADDHMNVIKGMMQQNYSQQA